MHQALAAWVTSKQEDHGWTKSSCHSNLFFLVTPTWCWITLIYSASTQHLDQLQEIWFTVLPPEDRYSTSQGSQLSHVEINQPSSNQLFNIKCENTLNVNPNYVASFGIHLLNLEYQTTPVDYQRTCTQCTVNVTYLIFNKSPGALWFPISTQLYSFSLYQG